MRPLRHPSSTAPKGYFFFAADFVGFLVFLATFFEVFFATFLATFFEVFFATFLATFFEVFFATFLVSDFPVSGVFFFKSTFGAAATLPPPVFFELLRFRARERAAGAGSDDD
jgi:hypothetical protein